jgi:hypothetical protein
VLLFVVLFFAFSGAIGFLGVRAIRQQQFEGRWKESSPFQHHSGTITLVGVDAIRFGIGLVAGAVILGVCGIEFFAVSIRGIITSSRGLRIIVLTCVSLPCYIIACVALFPPWELWPLGFYFSFSSMTILLMRVTRDKPIRKNGLLFLLAPVAAILGIGWLNLDSTSGAASRAGAFLGIFAALFFWAQLSVLIPKMNRGNHGLPGDSIPAHE